jgi:hypothetical protein
VTLAADEVVTESLRGIRKALTRGDLVAADAEALRLTVAQTVDVLERLPAQQRAVLYRMLPKDQALEVFEDLPPVLQKNLISSLQDEEVKAAFDDLDPDDRVALLDEVPASVGSQADAGPVDRRAGFDGRHPGLPEEVDRAPNEPRGLGAGTALDRGAGTGGRRQHPGLR